YGSVLPTSLTYIILSARGYSPWRPAADISTTKYEIYQASLGFSRTDESAPNTVKKSAFYGYQNPYLRTTRFQGMRPLKEKKTLFETHDGHFPSRLRYRAIELNANPTERLKRYSLSP
ncbi:conserved hypothetical protein, partial [Trichinella spiralis]|uniref:hypothetical protein n=1 Tax=Trichinella spiralis TaxID=6334 RepID=UPI0001EFDD25